MIGIVDYGVGNAASIVNMLRKVGVAAAPVRTRQEVYGAEKLILPGVGAFDHAARRLRASGLLEALEERVLGEKVPALGICLGFQLFTERSEEGSENGLGWIRGETVGFERARMTADERVPHMGWSEIEMRGHSSLFEQIEPEPRFYFVHSYHVRCANTVDVIARAVHGYEFDAAAEHENIVGVQFHPEKSHRFGMQVLRNFVERY